MSERKTNDIAKEKQPYDLTEQASLRENEDATRIARQVENDNNNEETNLENTAQPLAGLPDNKLPTSLDD